MEFKESSWGRRHTGLYVDIETEWNLKAEYCLPCPQTPSVDIETEWNLKVNLPWERDLRRYCRYRNRMEFKMDLLITTMESWQSRYRNRMEFEV